MGTSLEMAFFHNHRPMLSTMSTPALRKALRYHSPVTVLAGAATLATILSQSLSSTTMELCSEIVCWMILPILFGVERGSHANEANKQISFDSFGIQSTSSEPSWVVAVGVVIACLCKAEHNHVIGLYVSMLEIKAMGY